MPAERFGHPPPIVQSMILADGIHQDPSTKKWYILGTHNIVAVSKFPASIPLRLYMAITETHGLTALRIRIVDVDEVHGPIHESAHTVDLPDPTRVWEMTFGVAVTFPAAGNYRIQLMSGEELLRELRLRAVLAAQPSLPLDEV
jgi:hypothetical protein